MKLIVQATSIRKRIIFRHTTSPGCFSTGYVDYAKMIFQV